MFSSCGQTHKQKQTVEKNESYKKNVSPSKTCFIHSVSDIKKLFFSPQNFSISDYPAKSINTVPPVLKS